MKVILSAYACEPGLGSEPGVGWNIAKHLSEQVELLVVTRKSNQSAIESSNEPWVDRVRWLYWDPPKSLTFWKKRNRGVQLYYMIWQFGIRQVVEECIQSEKFDLIHHVTFGKYWMPSFLASLPLPFIFGPVGGGEKTPPSLAPEQPISSKLLDAAKSLASSIITRIFRSYYHQAAWTFAATSQTEQALRKLGVTKISLLPQSGISEGEIEILSSSRQHSVGPEHPLKLVTACRLIHWKAVDLAIEAVALASKSIPVKLTVLQSGPELGRLKKLASSLGVSDIVHFKGRLPTLNDVYREIASSDALVHPALHEAFGQSCLESLAIGTPVICLKWGGPSLIVDSTSGFVIEPDSRANTILHLSNSIIELNRYLQNGQSMAEQCRLRAFGAFSWSRLAFLITNKYSHLR